MKYKNQIKLISDLHGDLPNIKESIMGKNNSAVVISGDICPDFDYDRNINNIRQKEWIIDKFIPWCNSLPYDYIYFTFGNHDTVGDSPSLVNEIKDHLKLLSKTCKLLLNESVNIFSHNVYFTPYSSLNNLPPDMWSFMKNENILSEIYKSIPDNTDILISHGPPIYKLDNITRISSPLGSMALARRITELNKLKLVVFGHIHEQGGKTLVDYRKDQKIKYINCARCLMEFNL